MTRFAVGLEQSTEGRVPGFGIPPRMLSHVQLTVFRHISGLLSWNTGFTVSKNMERFPQVTERERGEEARALIGLCEFPSAVRSSAPDSDSSSR